VAANAKPSARFNFDNVILQKPAAAVTIPGRLIGSFDVHRFDEPSERIG